MERWMVLRAKSKFVLKFWRAVAELPWRGGGGLLKAFLNWSIGSIQLQLKELTIRDEE
jgi:hypothetical protein